MGLKVENISKSYNGNKVVDQISFELDNPQIFGLIGTNGAGKTTTIRMILGILAIDEGNISWDGKKISRENINFGYLPEERGIYPKTLIKNQLLYFAKLKGMNEKEAIKSINYWAEKLEISEYLNKTAEQLSKGNQQKVQILSSFVHNPKLLVLDEPFSGLDPVNTEVLKNVIKELIEKGIYIVFSSHQMAVVEEFCNQILILDRGKTIVKGKIQDIKNSYERTKLIINSNENIDKIISEYNIIRNVENEYELKLNDESEGKVILKKLVENNININKFELARPSLHEIFIKKVGERK